MRPLESVLAAVAVGAIYWPVVTGRRWRRGWMAVLVVVLDLAQWLFEGFRWQLVPLHLGVVALAIDDIGWEDRRVRGYRRFRRGALGIVGVALMLVLPAALPVPSMPEPSGPYQVATRTFTLVQPDTEERYGPDPGAPRRIPVQVWYPARVPDGTAPLPWLADFDAVAPALARRRGLPGFFLDHTRGVESSSYPDGEPYSGTIPVIIYVHGWAGTRSLALNQLESLASHGFLVVAADHTYAAVTTVFPDGSVEPLDPAALPDPEEVGDDEYDKAAARLLKTMTGDIQAIVDALAEGTARTFGEVAAMADLGAIGVYGYSAGGGAAVQFCLEDERCQAVLGLDPWVEPIPNRTVARELQVPSLFIRSDEWRTRPNDGRLRGLAERSPSISYWIGIEGTAHSDFVMTPIFSPVGSVIGLKGPIPADRIIPILDEYLVAFFQRYLFGVGGAALDDPPPAEVTLEVIP